MSKTKQTPAIQLNLFERLYPTAVVNFKDVKQHWDKHSQVWDSDQYVYIGRANRIYNLPDSPWGNPYRLEKKKDDKQRIKVIAQYRDYLVGDPQLMMNLAKLRGKTLVCWCRPAASHGDILAELASWSEDDLRRWAEGYIG